MMFMRNQLYYVMAAVVGVAGAEHLYLASTLMRTPVLQFGMFFAIAGGIQLFWVIPAMKRFGRVWLGTGVGGNIALVFLWAFTRMPNPITKMGLPVNVLGITVEVFELAFIALAISALCMLQKDAHGRQHEVTHKA